MVLLAPSASAAAYKYWSYQTWTDGKWASATKGPADVTPKDGAVDGWRYAVSGDTTPPRVPRADGDFEAICGSTPEAEGKKRVAVVIDYGIAEEAPKGEKPQPARGECASVATKASSAEVLAAVAEVRQDEQGLTCALDGYPKTGCGDPVEKEPKVPSPEPSVELRIAGDDAAGSDSEGAGSRDEGAGTAADEDSANAAEESGGSAPTIIGIVIAVVIVAGIAVAAIARSRRQRSEQ